MAVRIVATKEEEKRKRKVRRSIKKVDEDWQQTWPSAAVPNEEDQ